MNIKSFKPSQSCRPGVSASQTGNRSTTIASILEIVTQNKKDNLGIASIDYEYSKGSVREHLSIQFLSDTGTRTKEKSSAVPPRPKHKI